MAASLGNIARTETTNTFTNPALGPAYQGALAGVGGGYAALAQEVLPGYAQMYSDAMQNVQGFGDAERQQIQNAYSQALAQQQQSLTNRGLGNATVADTMRAGLLQQEQLPLTNLAEQVAQFKNQTMGQFGGMNLAAIQGIGMANLGAQQALAGTYLGGVSRLGTQRQVGLSQNYNLVAPPIGSPASGLRTNNDTAAAQNFANEQAGPSYAISPGQPMSQDPFGGYVPGYAQGQNYGVSGFGPQSYGGGPDMGGNPGNYDAAYGGGYAGSYYGGGSLGLL